VTWAGPTSATPTGEDMEYHCLWPATPCHDEHVAVPMVSYESIPAANVMAPMQYQCMAWGDHYASPAPAFCNEVIGEPMASSRKILVCLSDALCCEPKGSAQRYLAESAPLHTPVLSADYKPVAVPLAPLLLSPAPGSAELPSIGSAAHGQGRCKPCAFFHTKGCEIGPTCSFCHLCGVDERKRCRKDDPAASGCAGSQEGSRCSTSLNMTAVWVGEHRSIALEGPSLCRSQVRRLARWQAHVCVQSFS